MVGLASVSIVKYNHSNCSASQKHLITLSHLKTCHCFTRFYCANINSASSSTWFHVLTKELVKDSQHQQYEKANKNCFITFSD